MDEILTWKEVSDRSLLAPVLRYPTWRRWGAAAVLYDGLALGEGVWHRCSDASLIFQHRSLRGVGRYLDDHTPFLRNLGYGFWSAGILGDVGVLLEQNVESSQISKHPRWPEAFIMHRSASFQWRPR